MKRFLLLLLFGLIVNAFAADWPQYRMDTHRSGYTQDKLPAKLKLDWALNLGKPTPAWPKQRWQQMNFDFAYQPVISKGSMYVGSSTDHQVYAIDLKNGKIKWQTFTGGPIRFAPVIWQDRILVVSDDGFLYCLDAKTGKINWKFRAGPYPDKILGNGELISMFPARSGPVVKDGIVYFGAGVFPTQGYYLYALDAKTGKIVWKNQTSGNTRLYQYNHGFGYSNVAGQGYLVIAGDMLMVMTGRSIPAGFDLKTGKFLHYNPLEVYRAGSSWGMAMDNNLINADMVFDARTGAVLCPKVAQELKPIVRGRRKTEQKYDGRLLSAAATPELLLTVNGMELRAIDRKNPWKEDKEMEKRFARRGYFFATGRGRLSKKLRGVNEKWKLPISCAGEMIVAGSTAYLGTENKISAVDLNSKKEIWSAPVKGIAYGLAVANAKLLVSTSEGMIYCFGKGGRAKTITPPKANSFSKGEFTKAAAEILQKTGIKDGYCIDLNCGDGELAYQLAKQSKLKVCAFSSDPKKVAAARKKLAGTGLYGSRVSVHLLNPNQTELPRYLANLTVNAESLKTGKNTIPKKLVDHIQRPCGGKTCFGKPGSMKIQTRGKVKGSGNWTTQTGGPANTCASTDKAAKGPLGILWFNSHGPEGMVPSKSRVSAPLYIDGRLFILGKDFLRCIDAYNGRTIWERKGLRYRGERTSGLGANLMGSNYCISKDYVFFADDNKKTCLVIDAKTGKDVKTLKGPGNDSWQQLMFSDGLLYGVEFGNKFDVAFEGYLTPIGRQHRLLKSKYAEGKNIFAIDPQSGKVLWKFTAKDNIPGQGLAIGNGKVFFVDRQDLSAEMAKARNRGDKTKMSNAVGSIVCLDAKTGKEKWRVSKGIFGSLLGLSVKHNTLILGFPIQRRGNLLSNLTTKLAAYSASDGKKLWEHDVRYFQRPIILEDMVMIDPGGFDWVTGRFNNNTKKFFPYAYDIKTGKPVTRKNPITGKEELWCFGRSFKCSGWTASPNLIFFRNGALGYYDFLRDEGTSNVGGMRPGCFINVYAAGGLVLAPDNFGGCTCNYMVRTSLALQQIPKQQEHWGLYMGENPEEGVVEHLALNIGAIGDQRDADGTLWLAFPRPYMQKDTPQRIDARALTFNRRMINADLGTDWMKNSRLHASKRPITSWPCGISDTYRPTSLYQENADSQAIAKTNRPWIFTSGNTGTNSLEINVKKMPPQTKYKLTLYFAELAKNASGKRVFDIQVNDQVVFSGLDLAKEAKPATAIKKEFTVQPKGGKIKVKLVPKQDETIFSGLELKKIK